MTRSRARWFVATFGPPLGLFLVVLAVWQAVVVLGRVPAYLLPGPGRVFATAWQQRQTLVPAIGLTAGGALGGFVASLIVGTLVAFAFSQSGLVRRSCYPYAIFLQTVPVVAVAPMIVVWFGTGFSSVVLVAFILSVFPIITNGTTGLMVVEPALRELFALHHATKWQQVTKLQFPHALPYLVTGARISSGLAVIGAIVGEFFAGYGTQRHGLGYLIILTSGQLRTDYLFAAVLASTFLGHVIFSVVGLLGRKLVAGRPETKEL